MQPLAIPGTAGFPIAGKSVQCSLPYLQSRVRDVGLPGIFDDLFPSSLGRPLLAV